MTTPTLGQIIHAFFVDYLPATKGLRPSSIASYRDGMRLFLRFVAQDVGGTVVTLPLSAMSADRVLAFLRTLEVDRHNHVRTRNHRLAMLRTFFAYVGDRLPEYLATAEQVVCRTAFISATSSKSLTSNGGPRRRHCLDFVFPTALIEWTLLSSNLGPGVSHGHPVGAFLLCTERYGGRDPRHPV